MTATETGARAALPRVPLLIGVTGHRDLIAAEIAPLRAAVRDFLRGLTRQFPDTPLRVATALSEGADLLVAEEALGLGLECCAVLPMAPAAYRSDFSTAQDWARFEAALAGCRQQLTWPPPAPPVLLGDGDESALESAYAAAGELIASHAFILLALWDGRPSGAVGGTASIVEFRLSGRAWLNDAGATEPPELLPTLPPDLVYHIVASRSSGPPAAGLAPLQQGYRCTLRGPLEEAMPARAALVAARTAELNRDLAAYRPSRSHQGGLVDDLSAIPANVAHSAALFQRIDGVASSMQVNVLRAMFATSLLSLLMGVFFIFFTHLDGWSFAHGGIDGFLAAFTVMWAINYLARRFQWHRRYLEYRTLAEGLRVEFFWAIAGVAVDGATPAVHRTLLKQSDSSLDWIPNAIRAAGLALQEVRATGIPGGIDIAMNRWVGTGGEAATVCEQLSYYKRSSRRQAWTAERAEQVAGAVALAGLAVATLLAIETKLGSGWQHTTLIVTIGLLPLISGLIEALVQKTAARELQRQYTYMYTVFQAARDRLLAAASDAARCRILALLGRAALEEHANWLLLHRDRPIDRSRLQ